MTIIKTPYVSVTDQIVATNGLTNPNNNILEITQRGIAGNSTVLPDLTPINGYPKISLYEPFLLPAFGSGSDCLAYLTGCGFKIGYGSTGVIYLPTAASATASGTIYTIIYTGIPVGFNLLVNNSITGAATQGSSTGIIVSATINQSGNAVLIITSSSTFTTAELIINYVNRSVTTPDPAQTEIAAMTSWTLFSEMNQVGNQLTVASTTFPQTYMLLMGQHDTGYSPNTASITLVEPDFVTIQGTTTILSYLAIPTNWGLLPDNQLGNSMIQQGSTAIEGVFYQKGLGNLIGSATPLAVAYIILNNTIGTFLDSAAIQVILDGSQSVDIMNKGNYCKYWLGYTEINSTNTSLTSQFQTIIDTQNNFSNVEQNGGGLTFGFLSNTSQSLLTAQSSLQQLNDRYITTTYFPEPTFLLNSTSSITSTNATPSQVSSFIISCCSMNAAPFNPMNNIVSATINAPTNNSYWIQKNTQNVAGSSEGILQIGYTPLYVNTFGQVATVRIVNSQLFIPTTLTPDNEYYPFSTWQIISSWNEDITAFCKQKQFTNKRKDPNLKQSLLMGAINLALTYQTNGMFSNVNAFIPLFSVVDNPLNADEWIVNTPIQVIPELSGIQINVSIYSFLFNTGSIA